jgi:aminopeptidase S
MMRIMARPLVPIVAAIVLLAPSGLAAQDVARFTASLEAIVAGEGSAGRRAAIEAALKALDVTPELLPFGEGNRAGVNVAVTIPAKDAGLDVSGDVSVPGGGNKPAILIGAHYDRVTSGQGAVDNGASCAALLELIAAFKASPPERYTLRFVFFDKEEAGLLGSRAYLSKAERPVYAVNMDVFAYGDTLFTVASRNGGALVRALRAAGESAGIPVRDVPPAQYPGSDHQAMMAVGIETVGIALMDADDAEGILKDRRPRILRLIHSARDTLAEVRPEQVVRALPVVERLLRTVE